MLVAVLLLPLGGSAGGDGLRLNVDFISSSDDSEVSVLSPVFVPGVGNLPVVDAIVSSPANNLNSMSSKHAAAGVLVNASVVVLKVRVDGECGLHGSMLVDALSNVRSVVVEVHQPGEVVLVGREVSPC